MYFEINDLKNKEVFTVISMNYDFWFMNFLIFDFLNYDLYESYTWNDFLYIFFTFSLEKDL